MKYTPFLTILTAVVFAGAASSSTLKQRIDTTAFGGNTKPILIDELNAIISAKPVDARTVRVAFTVDGLEIQRPMTTEAKIGQLSSVQTIREFRYPSEFELPKVDPKADNVTPTTPITFEAQNTGMTVEFTPTLRGPFVILSGRLSDKTFEGFTQNAGDAFRPIQNRDGKLLSPNHVKTPMFTTRETPFYAVLQPGKADSFFAITEVGLKRVTVKCDAVD